MKSIYERGYEIKPATASSSKASTPTRKQKDDSKKLKSTKATDVTREMMLKNKQAKKK